MDVRTDKELLLSAYADGELDAEDVAAIEALLAEDRAAALMVEDTRALSSLLQASLEHSADDVDFAGFADVVMAKLTPHRPSLAVRARRALEDFFGQRRFQLALGAAAAAAVAVVATPYLREAPLSPGLLLAGDPAAVNVLDMNAVGDHETMLFKTSAGATIIFVQETR